METLNRNGSLVEPRFLEARKTAIVRTLVCAAMALMLNSCLGTVVGTAADVTIEVAKVPFKVAGAAIDVANGDDDGNGKKRSRD